MAISIATHHHSFINLFAFFSGCVYGVCVCIVCKVFLTQRLGESGRDDVGMYSNLREDVATAR